MLDSYETGGQNFTDDFFNEFKQSFGYDALPFIPAFYGYVVENQTISDRFLWDLRRFIADRVAYKYVGGLRKICNQNGLTTWLEGYGHWGFPGEFLQYGGQSDEIAGEFWSKGTLGDIENRAASSTGHIYGKNKISAESFTVVDKAFSNYPATLKLRGDKFFAEGINNTLLHVFVSQAYPDKFPGVNSWFGNEFNHHNTWFSQIDVFIEYLKRCNYMLQQGINVADVAYFIGEDVPKMTGVCDPPLPKGYQFDFINAEVIENNMHVKGNVLTLGHGTQYKILVLPKIETIRPSLLSKIKTLVHEGAIVLGEAPVRSPSQQNQPQADDQIKTLVQALWGDVDGIHKKYAKRGKGTIMSGMDLEEALRMINCRPDCKVLDNKHVDFGHRKTTDGEIYFISNQSKEDITTSIEFRVNAKQPELWDPLTGATRTLPAFVRATETTIVPIKLAVNQSAFIVFKSDAEPKGTTAEMNFPTPNLFLKIEEPWDVKFESKINTPSPIRINELKDWTYFANDSIKYFSGTAYYSSTFKMDKMPANKSFILDLNKVNVMAKVKINNTYVGGVWTNPYQLDITNHIVQGNNTIEIEVVNTWVNRLIGDFSLPSHERRTWTLVNDYQADSALQSSGLIGPVEIKTINNVE